MRMISSKTLSELLPSPGDCKKKWFLLPVQQTLLVTVEDKLFFLVHEQQWSVNTSTLIISLYFKQKKFPETAEYSVACYLLKPLLFLFKNRPFLIVNLFDFFVIQPAPTPFIIEIAFIYQR